MRKISSLLLTTALLASTSFSPALADDWHEHGDVHRFHHDDYHHWREGRWFNGPHEGRNGWWWVVGGLWYFYPSPVYPYPDPYTPPTVIVETTPASPTVVAPPSNVYYCPNPAGYYPYVPQCYTPWQKVASPETVVQPQPASPAPTIVAPGENQYTADEQKLDGFRAEFEHLRLEGERASLPLRTLARKVEGFREALYTRNYNAMRILKRTEELQKTIAAQRQRLKPVVVVPQGQPPY